jgi:hypothetical protein
LGFGVLEGLLQLRRGEDGEFFGNDSGGYLFNQISQGFAELPEIVGRDGRRGRRFTGTGRSFGLFTVSGQRRIWAWFRLLQCFTEPAKQFDMHVWDSWLAFGEGQPSLGLVSGILELDAWRWGCEGG